MIDYLLILHFWFGNNNQDKWFNKDPKFDQEIRKNFLPIYQAAISRKLEHWLDQDDSTLALIIILDQFPRNMFRDKKEMYASDELALYYTKLALEKNYDQNLSDHEKLFLYMPLMHSENLDDQKLCISLLKKNTSLKESLNFAKMHHDIIEKFGRFPHRNKILGRESSEAELKFLNQPNSSF